MTMIQTIKNQLNESGIRDNFFSFYKKMNFYKFKIVFPAFLIISLLWTFYCIFFMNILPHSFFNGILFFLMGTVIQPVGISAFFCYLVPIDSWFFKTVSRYYPMNQELKSNIMNAQYQDSILCSLMDNKEFISSMSQFYSLINNINFATSYDYQVVNQTNKSIKMNFDKLNVIFSTKNKKDFVAFFKNYFIFDYTTYATHPKVIEVLKLAGNLDQPESSSISFNSNSDLMDAIKEELSIQKKIKIV